MEFPRQEYWSGLPFPAPADLPDSGIEPVSPAVAGRFFTTEPPGKPNKLTEPWVKMQINMTIFMWIQTISDPLFWPKQKKIHSSNRWQHIMLSQTLWNCSSKITTSDNTVKVSTDIWLSLLSSTFILQLLSSSCSNHIGKLKRRYDVASMFASFKFLYVAPIAVIVSQIWFYFWFTVFSIVQLRSEGSNCRGFF